MASTRDIRTNQVDISCDICGRTLLRGEHAEHYLAGGERRQVCELCTARAQHEGWIREYGGDELTLRTSRTRARARRSWSSLRTRRERAREVADEAAAEEEAAASEPRGAARAAPEPPPSRRARPRHVRAVPTNAELKMRARARGLQRLRAHPHGRRRRPLAGRSRRSACARSPTARAWSRSP